MNLKIRQLGVVKEYLLVPRMDLTGKGSSGIEI